MKVSVSYIADDGSVFSNQQECEEYEKKKTTSIVSARFFSSFGWLKELTFSPDIFDKADYILVLDGQRFLEEIKQANFDDAIHDDIDYALTMAYYRNPAIIIKTPDGWENAYDAQNELHEAVDSMDNCIAELETYTKT